MKPDWDKLGQVRVRKYIGDRRIESHVVFLYVGYGVMHTFFRLLLKLRGTTVC